MLTLEDSHSFSLGGLSFQKASCGLQRCHQVHHLWSLVSDFKTKKCQVVGSTSISARPLWRWLPTLAIHSSWPWVFPKPHAMSQMCAAVLSMSVCRFAFFCNTNGRAMLQPCKTLVVSVRNLKIRTACCGYMKEVWEHTCIMLQWHEGSLRTNGAKPTFHLLLTGTGPEVNYLQEGLVYMELNSLLEKYGLRIHQHLCNLEDEDCELSYLAG